ncbi:Enolase [Niveomyces insectorum RCEF 264]|uniref:Enolase n=1 Tax=Niveomyces insectorum RCEF 264 TaxID=1081102 RepID=A0A167RC40_9HYPO|nr:Enolase [Niveomyces insectorum RCEF 264]
MIKKIVASQRFDSRGNPTVQVVLETEHGTFRALVPSGASTGVHEAVELRDGDPHAFGGKGVLQAVHNVNAVIAPALLAKSFDPATQLGAIDQFMCDLDGTPNKSRLGANAILGVSMAYARAGAAARGVPLYAFLRAEAASGRGAAAAADATDDTVGNSDAAPYVLPVPFFNVLNGGVHSGNTMAFQEIMLAPVGATSFAEAMQLAAEVYQQLKKVITKKFGAPATGIGDEGGFAPPITRAEEAFDLLTTAVEQAGHTGRIKFAMDPASSEFFTKEEGADSGGSGTYDTGFKDRQPNVLSSADLQALYHRLLAAYPIVLLEDPFAEDDWPSWTAFNRDCPVELVGDDLLVTNVERVRLAHEKQACNAMLLKINQIGTVTEAIAAANLAFSFGWGVFVSHRSGETTDDFIADLTVALNTGHLKSGAPARGERLAKYNRLLDIEAELQATGQTSVYAGASFRHPTKAA